MKRCRAHKWIQIIRGGPFDDPQAAIFGQIGGMSAMTIHCAECGTRNAAMELWRPVLALQERWHSGSGSGKFALSVRKIRQTSS
jgi:hypothetical protein